MGYNNVDQSVPFCPVKCPSPKLVCLSSPEPTSEMPRMQQDMQYLCKCAMPQGAINGPKEGSAPEMAQSAIRK